MFLLTCYKGSCTLFFFLLFDSKCPKDTQVLFDCILLTISDVEQHFHNSVGHFCVFFGECSIEIFVSLMVFFFTVSLFKFLNFVYESLLDM